MVMMAEPLQATLDAVRASGNGGRVIYFAPNGRKLDDARVREFAAAREDLVLICGRYEGVDERFLRRSVDEVVSLGASRRSALHAPRSLARGGGAGSAPHGAPRQHPNLDAPRKFAFHLADAPRSD